MLQNNEVCSRLEQAIKKNFFYRRSSAKCLVKSKKIKQIWAALENLDNCFAQSVVVSVKYLLLGGY